MAAGGYWTNAYAQPHKRTLMSGAYALCLAPTNRLVKPLAQPEKGRGNEYDQDARAKF